VYSMLGGVGWVLLKGVSELVFWGFFLITRLVV
jgi:hypothetical protein